MELQGFGGSLVGKTIWGVGDPWVPWEFLQDIKCRVLLRGASSALAAISDNWTYSIAPETAKDWSCVATILKALSASTSVLVAWCDDVAMSPAALRFLEGLPITRLMMGSRAPALVPDAVLFSKDCGTARSICERLPARGGHGPCALPPTEAWTELVASLHDSSMCLMVTDVEDKAWTLYWYKPADSAPLTAEEVKERVRAYLTAAQRLLGSP
jgi:hypothetical protein